MAGRPRKPPPEPKAQSKRHLGLAQVLEAAGELRPIDSGVALDRLMQKVLPDSRRGAARRLSAEGE